MNDLHDLQDSAVGIRREPPIRILVVDDDPKFRSLAVQGLADSGFTAVPVASAAEARAALGRSAFDVVLLDVMMPDVDGTALLRELRAAGDDVPVLLVTARGAVEERVDGLRTGADDYVVKPFSFAELVARIEVVVRRRRNPADLRCGELRIAAATRTVTCCGRHVELSPKEFDLLRALALSRDEGASRAALLRDVWRTRHDPGTNVVDVHIVRLRRKLEAAGGPVIETLRGRGYRLRTP